MTSNHLFPDSQISCKKPYPEANIALEYAEEGIAQLDEQGRYVMVDSAYANLVGYEPAAMIGMPWEPTVHPDDRPKVIAAYEQMLREGKGQAEARGVRKDGSIFYKQVVMISTYDRQQHLIGHYCFMKDITQRKQAEIALRENQTRLAQIIATIPNGIIIFNPDGTIALANATAQEILSLSSINWMGQQLKDIVSQVSTLEGLPLLEVELPFAQVMATHQALYNVEYAIEQLNGRTVIVLLNAAPIFNSLGEIEAVVTSFSDITERRRTQQALYLQTQRERLISAIAQKIRQSLHLEDILQTTVAEVREFLRGDRVTIYHFKSDGSGVFLVESVDQEFPSIQGRKLQAQVFANDSVLLSHRGSIQATEDIYQASLPPSDIALLRQFQVRANLVVPICLGESLWGLLIVHQCSHPRQWQAFDIELMEQLASQVGIAIQQSQLYEKLECANENLQRLVCLDPLTYVGNRRRFDEYLAQVWKQMKGLKIPLGLILCDIDYFKNYNDTCGHLAGDWCLQKVANAIGSAVKRSSDLVARYGGEEFAVILPYTNLLGAIHVAKRIQEQVRLLKIPHPNSTVSEYVSLSLGIATLMPDHDTSIETLINLADQGLYLAKKEGRDRWQTIPKIQFSLLSH